ncbi:lipopolysaccharide heptosyltransferase II [Vibrio hannami]|uniref:lipopolysaccharide heptosyltransferase II n=1 Tax=Vibrio hannami TaxID=2717094 RepID=UPI002410679B|nr:lipopolysaccharide heptosyltransferase II [Vibrio hannami]MDG3086920.1 lipopolysaccharide heptosyltransferase II [Vibrio hannami]
MKILIIGPSWVGDMVMSQSLYKELINTNPEATIDVLAPTWCKPILERMPEVNEAIEMPIGHGAFNLKERWKIGRKLAKNNYDHAFILPNSAKSALIPAFAGITKRTGWKGEFRYGLLNDIRPDKRIFQYMVERYVALAHPKLEMLDRVSLNVIEEPELEVSEEKQTSIKTKLGLNSTRPIIGLCPGAEFGPAKRWPEEYYTEVAEHAIKSGQQIWLFGSQKDQETTQLIRDGLSDESKGHCFDLAGKTSLIEAVDMLACCHTVISNDSGLMHVSAAVGCNIIALYGSTSPEYTPPLTEKLSILHTDIECRPCFKRTCPLRHLNCLKELKPESVIGALSTSISIQLQ